MASRPCFHDPDARCTDPSCLICGTTVERVANALRTPAERPFDQAVLVRRCKMRDSRFGACDRARMAVCGMDCPTDFPSLSLMKLPRIEAPTGRGIRHDHHAYPAPEGAPRPRIRLLGGIGRRTYVCASLHEHHLDKGRFYQHVGFGGTEINAWNAWVSRLESIKARGAQW